MECLNKWRKDPITSIRVNKGLEKREERCHNKLTGGTLNITHIPAGALLVKLHTKM